MTTTDTTTDTAIGGDLIDPDSIIGERNARSREFEQQRLENPLDKLDRVRRHGLGGRLAKRGTSRGEGASMNDV